MCGGGDELEVRHGWLVYYMKMYLLSLSMIMPPRARELFILDSSRKERTVLLFFLKFLFFPAPFGTAETRNEEKKHPAPGPQRGDPARTAERQQ